MMQNAALSLHGLTYSLEIEHSCAKRPIYIDDLPIEKMLIFHSYAKFTESNLAKKTFWLSDDA
jgi:hypothetical protein